MTISLKHAFTSAKADGPDNTIVQPSDWNDEHTLTLAQGNVLGRASGAGNGAVQELPLAVATDGTTVISTNSSSTALRITQTGAGNALVVEDSTNPDSTPFVVDASGNVGIGTTSPGQKLSVVGTVESTTGGFKFPDATTQTTAALPIDPQTFNSSGTWTKPTGYATDSRVLIQAWGAGGSGGKGSASWNAGGGGGGGYIERWLNLSQLGATETITIGAGGTTRTTTGAGTAGGNTTVGSLVTAYGGGPGMGSGTANGGPGSGGGMTSAGTAGVTAGTNLPGKPYIMAGYDATNGAYYQGGSAWLVTAATPDSIYHGGSGGAGSTSGCGGGNSVYGGGGGGGSALNVNAAGTSLFGGNGGNGGATPAAGTQPGGGGGAGTNGAASNGAGAAGRVIITVFGA